MVPDEFVKWWGSTKDQIEQFLGLSPDAMHIHLSVLIFIIWTVILRTRYEDWRPWALTFLVECLNETIDMSQAGGSLDANWAATRHDVVNTMIAPTLILVGAIIIRKSKIR